MSVWPLRVLVGWPPWRASQIKTVLSAEAEATVTPSLDQARPCTKSVCPLSVVLTLPLSMFHILMSVLLGGPIGFGIWRQAKRDGLISKSRD